MFKTELGLVDSYKKLMREEGAMFMARYVLVRNNLYIIFMDKRFKGSSFINRMNHSFSIYSHLILTNFTCGFSLF